MKHSANVEYSFGSIVQAGKGLKTAAQHSSLDWLNVNSSVFSIWRKYSPWNSTHNKTKTYFIAIIQCNHFNTIYDSLCKGCMKKLMETVALFVNISCCMFVKSVQRRRPIPVQKPWKRSIVFFFVQTLATTRLMNGTFARVKETKTSIIKPSKLSQITIRSPIARCAVFRGFPIHRISKWPKLFDNA